MLARSSSLLTRAAVCSTLRRPFTSTSLAPLSQTPLLRNDDEPTQSKAGGILESVLYGSKKSKEEDKATHSKVLARGKYVHELQSEYLFGKVWGRSGHWMLYPLETTVTYDVIHRTQSEAWPSGGVHGSHVMYRIGSSAFMECHILTQSST